MDKCDQLSNFSLGWCRGDSKGNQCFDTHTRTKKKNGGKTVKLRFPRNPISGVGLPTLAWLSQNREEPTWRISTKKKEKQHCRLARKPSGTLIVIFSFFWSILSLDCYDLLRAKGRRSFKDIPGSSPFLVDPQGKIPNTKDPCTNQRWITPNIINIKNGSRFWAK